MRATTGALVGAAGAALTDQSEWLLAVPAGLAVALVGLLLFLPAEGPITRFERIVAAIRGRRPNRPPPTD